jgi:cobalamin biosynthetic protein CobC
MLHGGDLDAARRRFPAAPEPWIDLSTGINPDAYPLPSLDRAAWSRLPLESDEQALRVAAARRYGVSDPRMVVCAPGSQAIIQVVPRLIGSTRVAILGPTYAEHAAAWRREGHEVREIDDLTGADRTSVLVVVNPDNPTGRVAPTSELRLRASELAKRGGLLVVDEAFADMMPAGVSLASNLPPATIVLRSFGKTFGLAGLRLGFGIALGEIAGRMRDYLGPWAVSGPAIAIGTVALSDSRWLGQSREKAHLACRRLDALLQGCGFSVIGGTPLFRLTSHPLAPQIADALGRHGVHVRRFPRARTWLRFGLPGTEPAWQRVEQALLTAGAQNCHRPGRG